MGGGVTSTTRVVVSLDGAMQVVAFSFIIYGALIGLKFFLVNYTVGVFTG